MFENSKNIKIIYLHCHIKRQKVPDWHQKIKKMIKIYSMFCCYGIDVKYVDFGGELLIDDIKEMKCIAMDMVNVIESICNEGIGSPGIILEPGAEIVVSSMCWVSRVVRTKKIEFRHYAVIYASRFHVNLMKRRKEIGCTVISKNDTITNDDESTIVGSTCLEDDIFIEIKPNLQIDDYIIFHNLGAYVFNLIPQFGFEKFEIIIDSR